MTYNEFIENIIETRGQWNIPDGEYFETHHIIPRCMGGLPAGKVTGVKHENLIWLYPQEHYTAHKLLAEENPNNDKLQLAWGVMHYTNNVELSCDEYSILKKQLSIAASHRFKGRIFSESHKKKISDSHKGDKNPMYNHIFTEEERLELSNRMKGDKNPSYGKRWYNNGVEQIYLSESDIIPDGFVAGVLPRTDEYITKLKNSLAGKHKGRHWYNNGDVCVCTYECPDGYKPGRINLKKYERRSNG